MKVLGIGMGLGGAVLCIFTQPSDDLASNAPLGNLMCLASSLVYAVYLVFSNRLLKGVGDMTMLKYTFLGAAVMAVVVNTIYGFDAPILKMSLFSTPMLVLLFVLVFPTTISYLLLPLGLKYLKTTLVAIYGYLILIVATVTSFVLGQDRFSWTQLAAIVLICASVYLVEVAESKSEKQIISKSDKTADKSQNENDSAAGAFTYFLECELCRQVKRRTKRKEYNFTLYVSVRNQFYL